MTASLRRMLRVLGSCLLGAAVSLAAGASAPVRSATDGWTAPVAEAAPAISVALPRRSFKSRTFEDVEVQLTGPAKSAGHRYNRRSSAEDTTSPAPDVLQAAVLRVAIEPETRPRPEPLVRRSAFASPATRQRAP